jgi:(2Fe-2S) ferredoxin
MPPPFERHIFVCTNRRPDGNPKGCCASKGSEEVRARFKSELDKRGLKGAFRANAAGCLDACERGISVVVYPEGVWYGGVKQEDVAEIIDEHIVGGRPVQRLLMEPYPKK